MNCFNLVFERYACVFFSARWGGGNGNNGRLPSQKSSQTKNRNSQRQQQPQTLSPARPPRYVFLKNIYVVNWNAERQGFWWFFVAKHNQKNRQMKAGQSNKYDIIKTCSLLQVCDCIENRWLESLFLNLPNTKAKLLQLNRTHFPSLGFFVSKKIGNQIN